MMHHQKGKKTNSKETYLVDRYSCIKSRRLWKSCKECKEFSTNKTFKSSTKEIKPLVRAQMAYNRPQLSEITMRLCNGLKNLIFNSLFVTSILENNNSESTSRQKVYKSRSKMRKKGSRVKTSVQR